MSRTVRRKQAKYHYCWVLRDWMFVNGFIQRITISPYSKAGKKAIAEFHADHGFGDYSHMSPPHWYRRMCNKQFSQRESRYLHIRKKLGDDHYEVPLPVRVRNANWYW